MNLGKISNIDSGLILSRKRARNDLEIVESYKVLSLNNIEVQGDFNEVELDEFHSNDKLDKHYFTEAGDVLLRLNEPFTAVYIEGRQADILIPSYFVSIQIKHKHFLPEYVSWYLNTNVVKEKFNREQSGTSTPNVNQKIIRELVIPPLPLEDQRNITSLHRLYLRERRLLQRLITEKDSYYEGITNGIIKEKMEDYKNE